MPADSMSDNGGAAGASQRELEIRGEVEALLGRLFLPKYAAVLEGELVALLANGMAQNLGAIEHRLKREAAKHQGEAKRPRLVVSNRRNGE